MPIIRSHKHLLKSCRLHKKKNNSKEKNDLPTSGTGLRGFRSISKYNSFQEDLIIQENLGEQYDDEVFIDLWSLNHEDQVMESDIHDRTRWKSSKKKTIERNKARLNKENT